MGGVCPAAVLGAEPQALAVDVEVRRLARRPRPPCRTRVDADRGLRSARAARRTATISARIESAISAGVARADVEARRRADARARPRSASAASTAAPRLRLATSPTYGDRRGQRRREHAPPRPGRARRRPPRRRRLGSAAATGHDLVADARPELAQRPRRSARRRRRRAAARAAAARGRSRAPPPLRHGLCDDGTAPRRPRRRGPSSPGSAVTMRSSSGSPVSSARSACRRTLSSRALAADEAVDRAVAEHERGVARARRSSGAGRGRPSPGRTASAWRAGARARPGWRASLRRRGLPCIASHTRAGVQRHVDVPDAVGLCSASMTALTIAGGEPTVADSPTPFAPIGWCGDGVTVVAGLPVGHLQRRRDAGSP